VIFGELLQPAGPPQIDSTVAGPDAGVVVVANQQDRNRGADRCTVACATQIHNLLVGAKNLGLALFQEIERSFRLLDCVERFHQYPACQITSRVAPHAVGHGPQPGVGAHQA